MSILFCVYEFKNNIPIEFEGEQELDIVNIKYRTKSIHA